MGKKNKHPKTLLLPEEIYIVMEQDGDSVYPLSYTDLDGIDNGQRVGTYMLTGVGMMRVARVLDDTRDD
jgi:hypothetical protein